MPKRMKDVCCFCGKPLVGYGNDPSPIVIKGKCCDECNSNYIIPYRLLEFYAKRERDTQ